MAVNNLILSNKFSLFFKVVVKIHFNSFDASSATGSCSLLHFPSPARRHKRGSVPDTVGVLLLVSGHCSCHPCRLICGLGCATAYSPTWLTRQSAAIWHHKPTWLTLTRSPCLPHDQLSLWGPSLPARSGLVRLEPQSSSHRTSDIPSVSVSYTRVPL